MESNKLFVLLKSCIEVWVVNKWVSHSLTTTQLQIPPEAKRYLGVQKNLNMTFCTFELQTNLFFLINTKQKIPLNFLFLDTL